MTNVKATIKVPGTFHTAAVVVCVALRSFAAEQKERSVESPVLTRHWCVHLQQRGRGLTTGNSSGSQSGSVHPSSFSKCVINKVVDVYMEVNSHLQH